METLRPLDIHPEPGNSFSESNYWSQVLGESLAVALVDGEGRIRHWSPGAAKLFGYRESEIIGEPLAKLSPPGFLQAPTFSKEEGFHRALKQKKDGSCFSSYAHWTPVPSPDGTRAHAAVAFFPAEIDASAQTGVPEVRPVARADFIAYLSHELRTPLAAILGFAEMMYDARQSLSQRMHCIGKIRQSVKNLTDLVRDVHDFTNVESGVLEVRPVTFSFIPELGEIISHLQAQAWKKRLKLILSFLGPLPSTITTDPVRLRQVVTNVIEAALARTQRGNLELTVSAERYAAGRSLLAFEVLCGLEDPSSADSLFEFPTDEETPLAGRHEHGLSMILARRLAQLLGGDLLEPTPGRRRRIRMTIDSGTDENTQWLDRVTEVELKLNSEAVPEAAKDKVLEGMRILVVEDALDIQTLLRHFLQRCGAHVEVAENGEESVAKARTQRFHLILMDLQLPLLNGYEATRQIQKNGYRGPIVALTSHAMRGIREKCLAAGCTDYLTKPIHANALVELLQKYASKPGYGISH